MAEPLKNFYTPAVIRRLAGEIARAWPAFPRVRFVRAATRNLDALELVERARQTATALGTLLPADRKQALAILEGSLGPERTSTEGEGMAVFFYLPHVLFVSTYGLDHFEEAMRLQHALTRRFTAEFSIRAFIERYPRQTLERLATWARDPNPHVRRLVSEGTRPRLPWARRLRGFQKDPRPVLRLLELLKDDPEPYVQRSVANNLNDIGKDHPDVLLAVCRKWKRGAGPGRLGILRHALRSRIKAGDPGALALLGFGAAEGWVVRGQASPNPVAIGQRARVVLEVTNGSARPGRVAVDLAVSFVKARGQLSRKVFKGKNLELEAGASMEIAKTISFAHHTTRVPYPGKHRIEAIVSGRAVAVAELLVRSR